MSAWCTRHDGGRKFVTCWLAWLLIHTSQFLFSPGWICLNYGEINCPWNGGSVVQDSHGNTNVSPPPHLASRVCCCFPGSWVLLSGGREKIKGMHSSYVPAWAIPCSSPAGQMQRVTAGWLFYYLPWYTSYSHSMQLLMIAFLGYFIKWNKISCSLNLSEKVSCLKF